MSIPIHITIHLSIPTALEILNVAINGGCESWAHITEKQSGPEDRHVYTSAKFTSRANSAVCMTVSEREVATGIQRVLDNGFPIAPAVKKNILRAVANNDAGEVDTEAPPWSHQARLAAAWRLNAHEKPSNDNSR